MMRTRHCGLCPGVRMICGLLCLLVFGHMAGMSRTLAAAEDASPAAELSFPLQARRIVFLGDSNTHAGHYISLIEAQLRAAGVQPLPELINLGLPSETCNGLSEPDHPFPRPNVHERLQRALQLARPDVVVVCYGMNDGIYHPPSEDRLLAFQTGMSKLLEAVRAAGAKIVLLTPPAFDPQPGRQQGKLAARDAKQFAWFAPYADYDDVMKQYADWILQQQDHADLIVDIHTPLNAFLVSKRRTDPSYAMSGDGVHFNQDGHRVVADEILKAWGVTPQPELSERLLELVARRQELLHAAWLSHVGHQRPGMQPGLPLADAQQQAADIAAKIDAQLDSPVRVELNVEDLQGRALPCRIHWWDEQGVAVRPAGLPFWYDHFVCEGQVELQLAPGQYHFLIERGPEFARREGQVTVASRMPLELRFSLARVADLRSQGWYSADLHVHRPIEDAERLMQAEDLDLVPVITWWNARNLWTDRELPTDAWQATSDGRWLSVTAGEDEREGGALLYFGLRQPLAITGATREIPSPLDYVRDAQRQREDVWIDIEKPFWWDVPVWLAAQQMHSVGLANNHMCRDQMLANEAWGKPRDAERLPSPRGNGFWSQEIYYHMLDAGFRIPPSAGSASGVLPNPVGYNRVYVHLNEPMTAAAWWRGLAQGACFVTNGPLLICEVDGQLPGSVLTLDEAGHRLARLHIDLTSRDPMERLEVVANGRVVQQWDVMAAEHQQFECELPLSESGWFLVRGIVDDPRTFRFVSTGPFYVEQAGQPQRISRQAVRFFQDWVDERIERLKQNLDKWPPVEAASATPHQQRADVLSYHERAREFWRQRQAEANAD